MVTVPVNYRIDHCPIAGSPRMGYFVVNTDDDTDYYGPFDFEEGAEEERLRLLNDGS